MTMYNCWCPKDGCPNNEKNIILDKEKGAKVIKCPECNAVMKILGETAPAYGKFSSLSFEDKKKSLKERSRIDNQKPENKQRREHIKENNIN